MAELFTIGHSVRPLADFSSVLQAHEIALVVDVRAFPASRRNQQFDRQALEFWLPEIGVGYQWQPAMGGKRKATMKDGDSPNTALREEAFRNYADYMLTPAFEEAAGALLATAQHKRVAVMCAEKDYRDCHRQMIADYFAIRGHRVMHIEDREPPVAHVVSAEAQLADGRLVYRGLF